MRIIILLAVVALSSQALASETLLECIHPNAEKIQYLRIYKDLSPLDSVGQMGDKGQWMNIICNDADKLILRGEDIRCAGVNNHSYGTPAYAKTVIRHTEGRYMWGSVVCK